MLRRYRPASYKHMLVSDSETESDDELKKGNPRNKIMNSETESDDELRKRNLTSKRKGKRWLSSYKVARPFKSKEICERGIKTHTYNHTPRPAQIKRRKTLITIEGTNRGGGIASATHTQQRFSPLPSSSLSSTRNMVSILGGGEGRKNYELLFSHVNPAQFDLLLYALVKLAKKYQKRIKKIPLPTVHLNESVFVTWKGLAKNLKRLCGQPLHYLTYMLCKEWDKSRFGNKDEGKPLNTILNWHDAEDTIWKVEAIHRTCTSPIHLAMLWLSDPEYHVIVNEVIPSHSR